MSKLPIPAPERRGARATSSRPAPIPLRPDLNAVREGNVATLVRACLAKARAAGRGGVVTAADVEHDREAFELIARAATSPMTTLNGSLRTLVTDFVAALGPASAGAALLSQSLQLAFDGYGAISVPSFVADPDNVAFVAEGRPIPIKDFASENTLGGSIA